MKFNEKTNVFDIDWDLNPQNQTIFAFFKRYCFDSNNNSNSNKQSKSVQNKKYIVFDFARIQKNQFQFPKTTHIFKK